MVILFSLVIFSCVGFFVHNRDKMLGGIVSHFFMSLSVADPSLNPVCIQSFCSRIRVQT
jgi:hypothetical protein